MIRLGLLAFCEKMSALESLPFLPHLLVESALLLTTLVGDA